jgi:hypothetical protein
MKTLKLSALLLFGLLATDGIASSQKLGYSGRFANADGSPVSGPVNVTVEIMTGAASAEVTRCTTFVNSLPLSNGVFNVELDFATTCDGNTKNLAEILGESFSDATFQPTWIRLTTTSTSPAVVYGPNPIYASPVALHALSTVIPNQSIEDTHLKGVASNCNSGEILTSDGSGGFSCSPAPSGGGGGGSGDITAVLQGSGISVSGGDTGDATVAHADTSSVADISNNNGNVLQSISFDGFGHVQSASSIDLDARYDARYLQSIQDGSVSNTSLSGISGNCSSGEILEANGSGGFNCIAASSATGDITSVNAGAGISITSPLTGDPSVSHADTSSATDISNNNGNVLQSVTFDTYGHVQSMTSIDLDGRYVVAPSCTSGQAVTSNGSGGFTCTTITPGTGDIESIAAADSSLVVTSGASGDATVAHGDTSSVANTSNSNGSVLQNVTFDTYGHVQSASSIDLDARYLQTLPAIVDTNLSGIGSNCSSGQMLQSNGSGGFSCVAAPSGGSGDIESVNAGSGITVVNPLSGAATVSHSDTSSVADVSNSNGNVLQSVTFDTYGHVQTATSIDLDARYDARYLQSVAAEAIDDLKLKGITSNCTAGQMLESDGAGGFACVAAPSGGGGGSYLPLAGGTMSGSIAMGGYNVTGASTLAATSVLSSGGTISGVGNVTSTAGNIVSSIGDIIATSGDVGSATLTVSGNGTVGGTFGVTGAATMGSTLAVTGNITGANISGTGFFYTSDRRFKENIEDIHGKEALKLIKSLQGVHFDWIGNGQKDIGFIAQDVQAAIPELVHEIEKESGNHLAVQYGNIVAIAVEAIKEQDREIAALKKQNEEMQKKLDLILKKLEEK